MAAKIDRLFDELLSRKGSDLHLAVAYPPLVRARGELVPLRDGAIDKEEIEDLLFEILTSEQKKQIVDGLDLDFAYAYGDKARFRATTSTR